MEREIYAATSPAVHNTAVLAKCNVRKQQGLHKEALAELARIYTYALSPEQLVEYYNNKALCNLLAGLADEALTTIDEAQIYLSAEECRQLSLLEALAAGEAGAWKRSHAAALVYLETLPQGSERLPELEALYRKVPRMRDPQLAWWLSLLPGVGQFYVGEVWSGLVSLVANGALGYFAVSEMVAGHYLSGWIVGCGGLSTTYFVGQERARMLTERRNARVLREHNDILRDILLK